MDVNGNDDLTITDIYLIYMRILGRSWRSGVPTYRLFTTSEWNTINNSTSNLKGTYPGTKSITLTGLTNKGSTNYYLVRTGYLN